MDQYLTVSIPRGFQDNNGSWVQCVKLRQLNGHDEQYLNEIGNQVPSTFKITTLLKRVIRFDESEITNRQP